jgi:hypothetical protein
MTKSEFKTRRNPDQTDRGQRPRSSFLFRAMSFEKGDASESGMTVAKTSLSILFCLFSVSSDLDKGETAECVRSTTTSILFSRAQHSLYPLSPEETPRSTRRLRNRVAPRTPS